MDLLVVPTISFDLLYAFVIMRLDRRVARQITEAFPWDGASRYVIRDRDRIYGTVVTGRLLTMAFATSLLHQPHLGRAALSSGLIGSIRRECLDHVIVLGEAHLRRILKNYAD
jgi:hypothetical protein